MENWFRDLKIQTPSTVRHRSLFAKWNVLQAELPTPEHHQEHQLQRAQKMLFNIVLRREEMKKSCFILLSVIFFILFYFAFTKI